MYQTLQTSNDYLSSVLGRLKDEGFTITRDVTYKNQTFVAISKKTQWEVQYYSFITTFFIFSKFFVPDIKTLRTFSKTCFEYAVKNAGIHLPRGFCYGLNCYSVAIVSSISPETKDKIKGEAPPKHWGACEMPVVFNQPDQAVYYFEKTPMLGALTYDQLRFTVYNMLGDGIPYVRKITDPDTLSGQVDVAMRRTSVTTVKIMHYLALAVSIILTLMALLMPLFGVPPVHSDSRLGLDAILIVLGLSVAFLITGYFSPILASKITKEEKSDYTVRFIFSARMTTPAICVFLCFVLARYGASWYIWLPLNIVACLLLLFTIPTEQIWEKWKNRQPNPDS